VSQRWYVVRVQSNREKRVRENLERRVKAQNMEHVIAEVLVPTERVTEIKSGKRRVTERNIYPGYIMDQDPRHHQAGRGSAQTQD
jgi:transcriptional antiterminator NusG